MSKKISAEKTDQHAERFGFLSPKQIDGYSRRRAIMALTKEHPASVWNFYFRVRDIDAALAKASESGGRIAHSPQEIPGGEYVLNGLDPQGAAFSLMANRSH